MPDTLYASVADLKDTYHLTFNDSDSTPDDFLSAVIEAVSRKIDDQCHRRFYSDSDAVARYYTALSADKLFVDDICSASSDVTVEIDINGDHVIDTTFSEADFQLEPYNAELDGIPYQKIEAIGQFNFPVNTRRGVKVTAKFGWASVPTPITQATLLQSERLVKRFATPLGSESMTALGRMTLTIPSLDPDVEILISRYIKPVWG